MCASFSRQQSRLPSFGAQKTIFNRFALKSGLDKPLKSLSVSGYSINGAKRIRTADPLHAIQEFDGPRLIASTGMTLK